MVLSGQGNLRTVALVVDEELTADVGLGGPALIARPRFTRQLEKELPMAIP
jgi:hypothetical protein